MQHHLTLMRKTFLYINDGWVQQKTRRKTIKTFADEYFYDNILVELKCENIPSLIKFPATFMMVFHKWINVIKKNIEKRFHRNKCEKTKTISYNRHKIRLSIECGKPFK